MGVILFLPPIGMHPPLVSLGKGYIIMTAAPGGVGIYIIII